MVVVVLVVMLRCTHNPLLARVVVECGGYHLYMF
jgi:hypothetical protein